MENYRILTISPGPTSTKIAVYNDEQLVFEEVIERPGAGVEKEQRVMGQCGFCQNAILNMLHEIGVDLTGLSVIVVDEMEDAARISDIPKQSGGLPVGDLMRFSSHGWLTPDVALKKIKGNGGFE